MIHSRSTSALRQSNPQTSTESAPASAPQHSMIVPALAPLPREDTDGDATLSEALMTHLARLGVKYGFGVFGGAIAPFCDAVARSPVRIVHCRHEAGAAFAAIEMSLASQQLTLVMSTTGPGMTNLLTGMVAARAEGAKVLFVTGHTGAAQRGRWAFQETSHYSVASTLFTSGNIFHQAAVINDTAELAPFLARVASGVNRPNGFVAHLGLPISIQTARMHMAELPRVSMTAPATCSDAVVETCVKLLSEEPFVIWAGFGTRHASRELRQLVEVSGARVMCSPRAKGIFPEESPLYLGVTGLGGHADVEAHMTRNRPARALVLGTRLGEFSSFWSPELVPSEGFIHVDLDPDAFGTAYPDAPTLGVQAEIRTFLQALLSRWPQAVRPHLEPMAPRTFELGSELRESGPVRPSVLMAMIQKELVENSDSVFLTEAGNSFTLGTHYLRFRDPSRYRVSTSFGSMGHAATGVIGAAIGSNKKAIAIVGDGSMLMLNEINTAANYKIDAVWVVLNDARYGMISQGMRSIGWEPFETDFPRSDFVAIAQAMGADGLRVEHETELQEALRRVRNTPGPFVLDVIIDPSEKAPANRRNQSLVAQGVTQGTATDGDLTL